MSILSRGILGERHLFQDGWVMDGLTTTGHDV
jgi:hypothetical protein